MQVSYRPVFQIALMHDYYADQSRFDDVVLIPSALSQALFKDYALVFRQLKNNFSLYSKIEPGVKPATLMHDILPKTAKYSFYIQLQESGFFNVSDLPDFTVGKEVLYFENITKLPAQPSEGAFTFLGSHQNNSRQGRVVQLQTDRFLNFNFANAVNSAVIKLKNGFGIELNEIVVQQDIDFTELKIDLAEMELQSGLYSMADNHGNSIEFYFDSELRASTAIIGVVEIFNSTLFYTPQEELTADHKFINAQNELVSKQPFALHFKSRATYWRYIFTKKYPTNSISLAELSVINMDGSVQFSKTVNGEEVVFTADTPIPIKENHLTIEMHRANNKYRDLPVPSKITSLQLYPPSFSSDMYVYV